MIRKILESITCKQEFKQIQNEINSSINENIFYKGKEYNFAINRLVMIVSTVFAVVGILNVIGFDDTAYFLRHNDYVIAQCLAWGCGLLSVIALILLKNKKKTIQALENLYKEHNYKLFQQKYNNKIMEYGNISKNISLYSSPSRYSNLFILDEKQELHCIDMVFNQWTLEITPYTRSCNYNDILKYEVIDDTKSELVSSTSVTNSNSGKAIGGAIATGLLLGNATVGAVIGGSGKQITQTTYQTQTTESYTLNIYINSLDDSIIKIKTNNRAVITDVISVMEYVINKQKQA